MTRKRIMYDVSAILLMIAYDIIILVTISSVQQITIGHVLMILSLVPSAILLFSSKCRIWRKTFAMKYIKYTRIAQFLLILTLTMSSINSKTLSHSLHEWTLLIPNAIFGLLIMIDDALEVYRKRK